MLCLLVIARIGACGCKTCAAIARKTYNAVRQYFRSGTLPFHVFDWQEERDFCFGRLFGLTVLLESEILLRPGSAEAISATIDHLVTLARKKRWLQEPSTKALCSLIVLIPRLQSGKSVTEEIVRKVEEGGLMPSQDGAAILLALKHLPNTPKVSSKTWTYGDPMHSANLKQLEKVLKETPGEDDTVKSSGNFKGEPHLIWTFILSEYTEDHCTSKGWEQFSHLWKAVVDGIHLSFI
jgi:hypothetical protein